MEYYYDKEMFVKLLECAHIPQKKLATYLGVSYRTLLRTIESGDFTRREIADITKLLGEEVLDKVFFRGR